MKYSQWTLPRGRLAVLAFLLSLLTACGGGAGGGNIVKNTQSNINTGQQGTGQGTLNCQSQPGTSDVCAQAPGTSQGSGGATNGITTDNAAHVANAILGVLTSAFDLGGVNGVADSLVTATQTSYRPASFDLPSFAMKLLVHVVETGQQPNTILGLHQGQLDVVCDSGTSAEDTTTNPGAITVEFQACVFAGATLDGRLTIDSISYTDARNYSARFSFTNFTVQKDQQTLELTGSMDFSTTSSDGLRGTGSITSTANSQSTSGGSLGITLNGQTYALNNMVIDYTFDLATNTNVLRIHGTSGIDSPGSLSSSIPGAPFSVSTPTPLVKSPPPSGFSGTVPGPFSGGTLRLVASDGSSLTLDITSALDDVSLQVNGGGTTAMSWAALLGS